jgi:WD40 repeat protein
MFTDSECVPAVGWTGSNVVSSASDDGSIVAWNADGEVQGKIATVNYKVTCMSWQQRSHSSGGELAALGASDGECRCKRNVAKRRDPLTLQAP